VAACDAPSGQQQVQATAGHEGGGDGRDHPRVVPHDGPKRSASVNEFNEQPMRIGGAATAIAHRAMIGAIPSVRICQAVGDEPPISILGFSQKATLDTGYPAACICISMNVARQHHGTGCQWNSAGVPPAALSGS
jgi:hypothetical protein